MKTYFIAMQVTPLAENQLIGKVEEAYVYFWIVDESPERAMQRASAYLINKQWKLDSVQREATEVTAADFANQEDGMMGFWKAKQNGFAAQVVARQKPEVKQEP